KLGVLRGESAIVSGPRTPWVRQCQFQITSDRSHLRSSIAWAVHSEKSQVPIVGRLKLRSRPPSACATITHRLRSRLFTRIRSSTFVSPQRRALFRDRTALVRMVITMAKRTREYTWHENISGWRDAALGYAAQTASASAAPSNKPLT